MSMDVRGVKAYLGTSVGAGEKNTGSGTGKGSSLTGVAKIAERLDGVRSGLLLAETSLGNSQKGREEEGLGHGDGYLGSKS